MILFGLFPVLQTGETALLVVLTPDVAKSSPLPPAATTITPCL